MAKYSFEIICMYILSNKEIDNTILILYGSYDCNLGKRLIDKAKDMKFSKGINQQYC